MKIVVLTAPSGAGKTSIAKRLLKAFPNMRFSVSATTRRPRNTERDGVDYFFMTNEAFKERVGRGDFVEFEEVYPGLLYGTLRSQLESATAEAPVLLDIDVRGANRVKQNFRDAVLAIYVKPPSIDVLLKRLRSRATDSAEDLAKREARFHMETEFENRFDHVVLNDDFETAVQETIDLVSAFLLATSDENAS